MSNLETALRRAYDDRAAMRRKANTGGPALPTTADVYTLARLFGGSPHGADADGVADIEFRPGYLPDAVEFAARAARNDWAVEIRDPIRSLSAPVVVQVLTRVDGPSTVDESLPRNCAECQTVEWWRLPSREADERRAAFHANGHVNAVEAADVNTAAPVARDRCPWCETTQRLTGGGFLVTHNAEGRACGGSGLLPTDAAPKRPAAPQPRSVADEWGF